MSCEKTGACAVCDFASHRLVELSAKAAHLSDLEAGKMVGKAEEE